MKIHKSFQEVAEANGQTISGSPVELDTFSPLINAESTENVEFFGDPQPWNEYDAKDQKDALIYIDDLIDSKQKEFDAQNNATTPEERAANRKVIERIVLGLIETHKGKYADVKKALMDVDIEAISDNYPFDDHFEEKYGGINEQKNN